MDSKFECTLRDPFKLINTGAEFAVDVNVSSYSNDPLPVALAGLWRKRFVSRIWQEQGVNIFIDLFVDGWIREMMFDGVPSDHCLCATKYAKSDLNGNPLGMAALAEDFAAVIQHSTDHESLLFAAYGSGAEVKEQCELNNWLWLPPYTTKTEGTDG